MPPQNKTMKTEIYTITDPVSQKSEIEEIASLLKKGEAVAIPTETVYGLGADGLNPEAVAKISCTLGPSVYIQVEKAEKKLPQMQKCLNFPSSYFG